MDSVLNQLLVSYSILRSAPPSTHIREVPSCSSWQLTEILNWSTYREQETVEHLALKGCTYAHHTLHPRLWNLWGRAGGKIRRASFLAATGQLQIWTQCLWQRAQDLDKFKADAIPAWSGGDGREVSWLAEELLTFDIVGRRKVS